MANIIERAIGAISPQWGLKREGAKNALAVLRGYEGASKGKRFSKWTTAKKMAPSQEFIQDGESLKLRARDLIKNNGWAQSGVREYLDSLVGTGTKVKFFNSNGVYTDLNESWKVWTQKRFCDYEGTKTLAGMERLSASARFVEGECFLRKMIVKTRKYTRNPAIKIPNIAIHLLSSDMLDTARKGENIVNGIEYQDGAPSAYYFFPINPSVKKSESVRVPADEVSHVTIEREIGQSRGITEFHAAIKILKDTDELEDASVIQRKIGACMMAFLKDVDFDEEGKPAMEIPTTLEAGSVVSLPPGADVKFSTPPVVSDFKDIAQHQLHKTASAIGLSYSGLTKDVSQVNYSSLRGARNTENRAISIDRVLYFAPQFIEKIADWFLDAMVAPSDVYAAWTPPPVLMLDPEKEGKAYTDMVRSGFQSWRDVVQMSGRDADDMLSEMSKDYETIDNLGLIFDCDPRKTSKAGQSQLEIETPA